MNQDITVRRSNQDALFKDGRLVVWFSCGAASACALKLVSHLSPLAVYCSLQKDEHPDNVRFRSDVEKWTGIQVTIIASEKYKSIEEVWEDRRYMSGPRGAPCTVAMKKIPRFNFQHADDTHIFGYTIDELDRLKLFEETNMDMNLSWPLVKARMSKTDCLQMLSKAGITIPVMYQLGFKNNNCIGCVKASSVKYWNLIRKFFPEVFARRCDQSRKIGCRLVQYKGKRIFLDELPENAQGGIQEDLSCGPHCSSKLLN